MRRTELLQETRKIRFEDACGGWQSGRLSQEEAAILLGVLSLLIASPFIKKNISLFFKNICCYLLYYLLTYFKIVLLF